QRCLRSRSMRCPPSQHSPCCNGLPGPDSRPEGRVPTRVPSDGNGRASHVDSRSSDARRAVRRTEGSPAMRALLIGLVAGGVLVYGVMHAQSPASTTASQGAAKTAPAQAVTRGNGIPGNVTQARVLADASRGDSWLVNGGNFESQHFSPLRIITDRNVGRL